MKPIQGSKADHYKAINVSIRADYIESLPGKPGVYLMKDAEGELLYIGKAKSLKKRILSYFKGKHDSAKTNTMMKQFESLEYIITDTEKEALILESNLIKKYSPRYNIRLKDDKSYPYIKITNEDYPRVLITRKLNDDGSYYYGPFTDVGSLRQILKFIKTLFKIRDCKNMDGPCLNYQIRICSAPCSGKISKESYRKLVDNVNLFFEGRYKDIIEILNGNMAKASRNQEYEKAAVIRDQIQSINDILERQKMEFNRNIDQDVIACSCDERLAVVVVFSVRNGKIVGKDDFSLNGVENTSSSKVLSAFLKQYYASPRHIPSQIVLQQKVDDEDLIADWLSEKKEAEVTLKTSEEGLEHRLVKMVARNAEIIKNQERTKGNALLDLKKCLKLPKIPRNIEAFDISNIKGTHAVGSMVAFEDGVPKKNRYRRYKIESKKPDDYSMMKEVLNRRYSRPLQGETIPKPDLVLVDGGKGQLNIALNVLKSLNINDIPVMGLAKEFEHVFIPQTSTPIVLPPNSKALYLLQQVRDEAHRFAISYHKKLRSKEFSHSILDEIRGIGEKRKMNLMQHFEDLEGIKKASIEELVEVEGISAKLAREIYKYLHK